MADNKFFNDITFEDLSDLYDDIESEAAAAENIVTDASDRTPVPVKKEEAPVNEGPVSGPAEEAGQEKEDNRKKDKENKKEKREKRPKKKKKFPWKAVLFTFLGLAVAGAAGAYGYGVNYYTTHFLPNTVAEGVSLENLTVDEASELLTRSHLDDDRNFTLTAMDGEKVTFDTLPLSIERHYEGIEDALLAQDKWHFLFKKDEVKKLSFDYHITYDKSGIDTALATLDICDPEKSQAPVDSFVYRDKDTGEFLVMDPVDGNTIDTAILSKAIADVVDGYGTELDIASTGAYLKAAVREDDTALNDTASTENKIEAVDISVVIGEGIVEKMSPKEFRGMISENPENCNLDNIIDAEGFNKYVDKIARTYTTKSTSGYRYFKSYTGERHAMETDYGWDVDEEGLASRLLPVVAEVAYSIFVDEIVHYSNPEHSVEIVWTQTAESHGERDTGNTWVEVDLTNQHVYCVVDGELKVETDCVSGLDRSADRRTPTGFYKINFKTTERDLVGFKPDGTESYRSHVHYWMPFNKNIGLHDATWRWKFGGNLYKTDGSHGCVNLPLGKAKALYGYVYKGMPVIVYK